VGEVWIGVTGFYATDNPHPGLAVTRALRAADPSWRILALVYDRFGTGAFASELFDAHARVPYPTRGREPLLSALGRIVRTQPIDVLVPTVDAEQLHYVTARAELRRLGIHTVLPTTRAFTARTKQRLPALGQRAGVDVPPTTVLPSVEAVARVARRSRYPQIVKGALVDTVVAQSPEHFRVGAAELASQWGYPLLAQPVIHGEEYDVAGVARRGELVASCVMKKLGTTNKGTAWSGVTVDEPRCVEHLGRLVKALAWDGAIEAEFIVEPDGNIVCFEINPRFPSWIALAAEAGANLPEVLVRLATGQSPERVHAKPGRLFARAVVERLYHGNPLSALDRPAVRHGLLPEAALRATPVTTSPPAAGVGVTGLNAADNPSPGLTVARALRAAAPSVRLVGLTHEVLATGVYVDGVWDEIRLVPFPSREEGGYADALIEQCRDARIDCLVPTLDIEIPVIAWLAPRLAEAGVRTLVPPLETLRRTAKSRLPELGEAGFRIPRTEPVNGYDDLARVSEAFGMPFVLKGPVADAKIIRTEDEAHVAARRLSASWGFPLLAQEFIAGEEFGIAAVADRRHRVVGSVVVRKDIRTANGNTWGGTAITDRRLGTLAERFAEALSWVGPFELEVLRHPRRGTFLIEVNGRFPAWVFLSAGTGANLPWAALRVARGEDVTPMTARAGAFYVRMAWDATASVDRMGALAVEGKVSGHVV
jgi:carbamoyl-phosphate synthase large subunit